MFASGPDDIPRKGSGLPTENPARSGKFVKLSRRLWKAAVES
jgi:hypothetical protein